MSWLGNCLQWHSILVPFVSFSFSVSGLIRTNKGAPGFTYPALPTVGSRDTQPGKKGYPALTHYGQNAPLYMLEYFQLQVTECPAQTSFKNKDIFISYDKKPSKLQGD